MQLYYSEVRQEWVLTGVDLPPIQIFSVRPTYTAKRKTLLQALEYLADVRPTLVFERIGLDRYEGKSVEELFHSRDSEPFDVVSAILPAIATMVAQPPVPSVDYTSQDSPYREGSVDPGRRDIGSNE